MYLEAYANHLLGVQVMAIINLQCYLVTFHKYIQVFFKKRRMSAYGWCAPGSLKSLWCGRWYVYVCVRPLGYEKLNSSSEVKPE